MSQFLAALCVACSLFLAKLGMGVSRLNACNIINVIVVYILVCIIVSIAYSYKTKLAFSSHNAHSYKILTI